ncbi:bifunctional DNA primase/polymerase [Cyanobium sp. LEGE 06143]|uniref:VapE domain-containing protein n=1 Tax=Cyanobium sp. LEGE 06143 TaxID=945727 RepID=UPI0018814291|nr:VapE domain-containing protein [Cyanobium sp. LEGE 06143]MBE9172559.1 bifunctional DNA primase/polymerase [Cyanobium sp. LEGE 06143]
MTSNINNWRASLPELEGLPLLPVGAGQDGKAPINPNTSRPLARWQKASFSPMQIQAMNDCVRGVGLRPGPDAGGLLVLDLDGASAISAVELRGVDHETTPTWQIQRTTAADRLKLIYRVPQEYWPLLGKGKAQLSTGDREQIDLFWRSGQAIVLGEHRPSGGAYTWRGGPEQVEALEPGHPLWPLVLELLGQAQGPQHQQATPRGPAATGTATKGVPVEQLLSREQASLWQKGAAEGRRNEALFRITIGLQAAADGAAQANLGTTGNPEALALDFAARCSPPIPEREARATVRSALGQPRQPDPGLAARIEYHQRSQQVAPQGEEPKPPKTKREIQLFLSELHTFEHDELLDLPVIDGSHVSAGFIPTYDQYLADRYRLEVHPRTAEGVLRYLCSRSPFNPIERYLQTVAARTETRLLTIQEIGKAFGIDAGDEVSLDALARHLVGAVKRGLQPGYKHDAVLILSGGQGFGKSEAIAALAPQRGWVDSDSSVPIFEGWPFLIRLAHCWHFVFDECDRMLRGKHSSEIKGMITRRFDQWARKNEKEKTEHPRRCVLWGTTNEEHGILNDPTGVRRFWIALVRHRCDPGWICQNHDSIWATAMAWAKAGATNYCPPGHPVEQALAERAWSASFESPLAPRLHDALNSLPVTEGFPGISQQELIHRALKEDLAGIRNKRERDDLVGEVARTITAAKFTSHGGQWRWEKGRRRFGGRNPVAGFFPVPAAAEAQACEATARTSFLDEPSVPVPTCADGVPEGRHGHSPWGAVDLKDCADRADQKERYTEQNVPEMESDDHHHSEGKPPCVVAKKVGTVGTDAEIPSSAVEVTVPTPAAQSARGRHTAKAPAGRSTSTGAPGPAPSWPPRTAQELLAWASRQPGGSGPDDLGAASWSVPDRDDWPPLDPSFRPEPVQVDGGFT